MIEYTAVTSVIYNVEIKSLNADYSMRNENLIYLKRFLRKFMEYKR